MDWATSSPDMENSSGFVPRRLSSTSSSLVNPVEHPYHNVTTPSNVSTLGVRPVKQGVQFHLNLNDGDVSTEIGDVMRCIKVIAEKTLYHWKFFPIILPPSLTGLDDGIDVSQQTATIKGKLFISPTFDELEEVALDPHGNPRRLSESQLKSVRQSGEFVVNSIHFPGQTHVWRLSEILQKGTKRADETLLNDLAVALRLIIIMAKDRFTGDVFSISESIKSLGEALKLLVDIGFGVPHTRPGSLEAKIQDAHKNYLVAELVVERSQKPQWRKYAEFLQVRVKDCAPMLNGDQLQERPPPIPYLYHTPHAPTSIDIDLRIWNKDLMSRAIPILTAITYKEPKGWYTQYRSRLISELKGLGYNDEEITVQVNEALMSEYLKRVFEAVIMNDELEKMSPGMGKLLVEQAKLSQILLGATDLVCKNMKLHQVEAQNYLKEHYPICSKIDPWMKQKLQQAQEIFRQEHQWSAHEEAVNQCREQSLVQGAYFLQRDLMFLRDQEPVLRKELGKVQHPTRSFVWKRRIWFPSDWVVTRTFAGRPEIIPTTVLDTPLADEDFSHNPGLSQSQYSLSRHHILNSSTKYPLWRWTCFMMRTWTLTIDAIYFFAVVIPWLSPLSLRALCSNHPFIPDYDLNPVNGGVCPKLRSRTHTLVSRLHALWMHVKLARDQFEAESDSGFLGKGFSRHLNRTWNFVLKGAFGTFFLLLLYPLACLLTCLLSSCLAMTAPIWVPIVTLATSLFSVFVYDIDSPSEDRNRWFIVFEALLWHGVALGVVQPLLALIVGSLLCPLASITLAVFALCRRGIRALWDTLLFHLVIKRFGRVPSADSFVARRTEGPGLASNFFYQITPEQALAAFESRLEMDELMAYKTETESLINAPQQELINFVTQVFDPFCANLKKEGVYSQLEDEARKLNMQLHAKIESRKKKLQLGLDDVVKEKIRMPARDLKLTLAHSSKILEVFYPLHVTNRQGISVEEFFERRNLETCDWKGLAGRLFSEIFSPSFLTPLEPTDYGFRLEVQHVNLSKYVAMLAATELNDDMDMVSVIHTPKGNLAIAMPFLDPSAFDPNGRTPALHPSSQESTSRRKSRRSMVSGRSTTSTAEIIPLQVPQPIPHPAVIALLTYNRENEKDSLNLESAATKRWLKIAEETVYDYTLHAHHPTDAHLVGTLTDDNSEMNSDANQEGNEPNIVTQGSGPNGAMDVLKTLEREEVDRTLDDARGELVYSEGEGDTSCVPTNPHLETDV